MCLRHAKKLFHKCVTPPPLMCYVLSTHFRPTKRYQSNSHMDADPRQDNRGAREFTIRKEKRQSMRDGEVT